MPDDDLDEVLIALVLAKRLELALRLVGDLARPLRQLVLVVLRVLQLVLQDFLDLLLGFLRQ